MMSDLSSLAVTATGSMEDLWKELRRELSSLKNIFEVIVTHDISHFLTADSSTCVLTGQL